MPAWPASLPKKPLNATTEVQSSSAVASFTPDVGPPMRRRRSTARIEQHSGQFILTKAQTLTLKNFHETACQEGALTFDAYDWLTGAAGKYIFVVPPSFAAVAGSVWRATVKLIKLP